MKVLHNVSLADRTSLHAGGLAKNFVAIESGDNLEAIVEKAQKPVWVLGYGTNVLVSDKGLDGTVISNCAGQIEVLGNKIRADSGANWDDLVQKAIDNNLWGLEFTSYIPGGVGAAIAGNIAAYGHSVEDSFVQASILNMQNGSVSVWPKDKLGFDYRNSILQAPGNENLIVLEANFSLSPSPRDELAYQSALKVAEEVGLKPDTLTNRRKIIFETRKRAGSILQDTSVGPWTAGSFFKNPAVGDEQVQNIIAHEETNVTKDMLLRQNIIHGGNRARVSAAHVLLAAGFHRGQTWGQVRLHPDHVLKIENLGKATASDIYRVVQEIIGMVKHKLDINLEPEVRFLGEF
ncbi:FAD-binding protein [Candidatus Saccharibacteria bacterium]|nr:FAD-binding protein [Candidatus Saccharibacteria bacterium]